MCRPKYLRLFTRVSDVTCLCVKSSCYIATGGLRMGVWRWKRYGAVCAGVRWGLYWHVFEREGV